MLTAGPPRHAEPCWPISNLAKALRIVQKNTRFGIVTLAILLSGCASDAPKLRTSDASDSISPHLACPLPSNCVNSLGTGSLLPLRYTGTAAQAMAMVQATLKTFPEATIVRSENLTLEVIFTTPVGFRDQVNFRIDAAIQRIDFRLRSLFGFFDWGKNRSRMREFAVRFERESGR